MEIPKDLKYTKDHEWVKLEKGVATVGITEFAQGELGDVVFVDLPAIGKGIKQREPVCVVESTKAASDVYAPISGSVAEVNSKLSNEPELVNKSPYTDGWMVKLKDPSESELKALLTPEEYSKLISQKH